MHYYYDLLVNLDDVAWEFYEWEKKDNILPVKKIPFVRVNEKEFKEISAHEGKIEKNWLEPYIGKTQIKKDKSKNLLLLSSTKNSLVNKIKNTGEILSRSKLLIEDENNCNELANSLKEITIPFLIQKKIPPKSDFRQALQEKNLIKIELKTLKETQNVSKCSYLYYEWFGTLEEDLSKMLEICLKELKKPYTSKIHKIASLIRLSYKECL